MFKRSEAERNVAKLGETQQTLSNAVDMIKKLQEEVNKLKESSTVEDEGTSTDTEQK
jgi:hypothetical protein